MVVVSVALRAQLASAHLIRVAAGLQAPLAAAPRALLETVACSRRQEAKWLVVGCEGA